MQNRRNVLRMIGASAASGAFIADFPNIARAQTTIRFGSYGGATDAGLYLADEYGFFKKAGLVVTYQRVQSVPTLMTALATNQLEVLGLSLNPSIFASVEQGINLRIVGDKQSLRPGFSTSRVIIRSGDLKPTEAETVRWLKGKAIASPSRSSIGTYLVRELLNKHGIGFSDVRIVELGFSNMLVALNTGAVDAAFILDPFLSQAVQSGAAKVVSDLTEFVPTGGSIVPLMYSETFTKNHDLAQAFMNAYVQGVRIYNDAYLKNRDKERVIEVIAKRSAVRPEIIRNGYPFGLDPNQRLDIQFFNKIQTYFVENKFLRKPANLENVVDSSFANAAVTELGEYS
jgi:NitT/TauT family transport system substrate-binding protein